jgi:riboflavin kinase/FMN adenylyltransferase
MIKTYNGFDKIQAKDQGAVIAIGNFDGVHRGHQLLIAQAKKIADASGKKLAVMTFSPHPRLFFGAQNEPFLLTNTHQKEYLLDELCAVDLLFNIPFTKEFAALSAEEFIQDVLVNGFGANHVVVGHDFCFGKMRSGKIDMLKACKAFETMVIDVLSHDNGTIYSSSEIRHALRRGDMDEANALLGWAWHVEAEVVHGDKRGRELGYPTANMKLGDYLCPALGIYATLVQIEGETTWRASATNIGIRPMFRADEPLIEAFIFDYSGDLYGKKLKVKPIQFLRGEAKFDSLDALKVQMAKDCHLAKEILSHYD